MDLNLDTFLTTVYCLIDDWYQVRYAPQKPVRPGKEPMCRSHCTSMQGAWGLGCG